MSRICLAKAQDAERIVGLMEQVHAQMADPSLFMCDDLPFVKRHIEDEGFILMAVNEDDRLDGMLLVRIPGMAKDNLGRDLGLPEESLCKVAHMESTVVAGHARGRGILCRLLREAENLAREKGFQYLAATVSPENPASYRNFEKQHFRLMMTKEKYGGKLRRIYLKDLEDEIVR